MKKYVVGFVAGVLFATSFTAYAATSLVGKKIQGETAVVLNGATLDTGIIVDGKSYAPVRSISESAGYNVTFKGGQVQLNKIVKVDNKIYTSIEAIDKRIAELKDTGIPRIQQEIDRLSDLISRSEAIIADPNSNQNDKDIAAALLTNNKALLQQYTGFKQKGEAELAELEQKKSMIEAESE